MKEMTNVASAVMTDEEKAELERDIKTNHAQATGPGGSPTPLEHQPTAPSPVTPLSASNIEANTTDSTTESQSVGPTRPVSSPPSSSSSPAPQSSTDASKTTLSEASAKRKGKQKLTQEQRKKLEELDKDRRKAMEERVRMLTDKLIERIRPFVEAKHPGDQEDPETVAFQQKMQREADDLKLESFGVEVCHPLLLPVL